MSDPAPPPLYSQDDPEDDIADTTPAGALTSEGLGPQILILPITDATNFQKGFVGAEGERAAIEGELQIKGAGPGQWNKVFVLLTICYTSDQAITYAPSSRMISFRTIETAYEREIELAAADLVLFSAPDTAEMDLPSSFSFAIPLTEDAPQCIHTPHSSLSHTLTATLQSSNSSLQPLTKTLTVHTRRYTSHPHILAIAPETHSFDDPTRVEVEVPRSTFKAGEPIPIYVKVPPPRRELVVDQGLRLRNIRAELIRIVKVKRDEGDSDSIDSEIESIATAEIDDSVEEGPSTAAVSTAVEKSSGTFGSQEPGFPFFHGASYKTIISRSGASCRFHSSHPVRLRFVLRQPLPSTSPSDRPSNLPDGDYGYLDGETQCASITQTSLLHSVLFCLNVHASFVDMSNRTERFSTVSIPVTIVPPSAPLPEVEEWVDAAYQKKHDRPPAKTIRLDECDVSAPHYQEGEAGPSAQPIGAPPPFEERDAPPPFFSHVPGASTSTRGAPPPFFPHPEASTSSRLPTFLESESEIFVPPDDEQAILTASPAQPIIPGEGTWFGFPPSDQFDGHSEEMQRSSTPPPTLEMATLDTNVTQLADFREPRTMEALGISLEQGEGEGDLPPPPAMDDPSDPPPSIDSDFRFPELRLSPPIRASPSPPHPTYNPSIEPDTTLSNPTPVPPATQAHRHAPPPYLVPGNEEGHEEHVTRPPPYMDFMPPTSDRP